MSSRKNTPPSEIEAFHDRMWKLARSKARNLNGSDVLAIVQKVSADVWSAGIDGISNVRPGDDLAAAAFDLTWMSPLIIALDKANAALNPTQEKTDG